MAKQFTIKGIIQFIDDKASETIKKVDERVSILKKNTDRIGKGMGQFGQGVKVVAAGGAVIGAGLGVAVKQAADFEQAMADINAVNDLTGAQFKTMRDAALKFGTGGAFGATEVAQGMLELSKAGLSVEQTLQAIPGVLSAAAAEGMDLGQASEIIVGILNGQNMSMDKASRVADVLAQTANKTSAGITDLGEAFKYSNILGTQGILTFDELAASLGLMANSGLKGSIAGTSLVNMFNQLAKPSKKVENTFQALGLGMVDFTDASGKWLPIPKIIEKIGKATDGLASDQERLAFLSDLVGVEGAKAFSTLRAEVKKGGFDTLLNDIKNADGAAKNMADKRLKSLQGAFKSLTSTAQTFAINMGDAFLGPLTDGVKQFTGLLADAGRVLIALNKDAKDLTQGDKDLINSPLGQFVIGLKEGIVESIAAAKSAFQSIVSTLQSFGFLTNNSEKETGKLVAKILLATAAIAPLLVALAGLGMAFTGLMGFITGPINMLRGFIGLMWNIGQMLPGIGNALMWVGKMWFKSFSLAFSAIKMVGTGMMWLITNPIGWVILGIVALVAIGWFLYKNWGDIAGGIKTLWTDMVNYVTGLWGYMTSFFSRNSIGDLILKALLLPLRMALTPLAEILSMLLKIGAVQSVLGKDRAAALKGFVDGVSLIPSQAEITQAAIVQPQSATQNAQSIQDQKVESSRLAAPMSSEQPTQVNVSQPPINLTIENITKLDGKEMSRQMSKQSIENSERAGMSQKDVKSRSLMTNGQFATGFGR